MADPISILTTVSAVLQLNIAVIKASQQLTQSLSPGFNPLEFHELANEATSYAALLQSTKSTIERTGDLQGLDALEPELALCAHQA